MVANGAETFMASYLLGFESGAFERLRLLFTGEQARGDTVRLTIDAKLCEYASSLLSRHEGGAIVVMNYRTGELLCSTSYPDFDPRSLSSVLQNSEDNGALINRVTQGLYPPGSTFKILTLASALENISGVMSRTYNCTGALTVDRTTVTEASSQVHGVLSVQEAFAESCNTAFASLALELGYGRLAQTASSFGFGDNFLFRDLIVYNSQYPTDNQSLDDLAWSGVGQGRVLATPLHMAMVAAAVANDGVMMEPRLMLSATTAQGQSRTLQPTRTYRARLQRGNRLRPSRRHGRLRAERHGAPGADQRLYGGRKDRQRGEQRRQGNQNARLVCGLCGKRRASAGHRGGHRARRLRRQHRHAHRPARALARH